MSATQGHLFVKAALNKHLVLPLCLCYHGYTKTLTDVFQSRHPRAIILVKTKERIHISIAWLQHVQLEIATYGSVEISKGNR